MSSVVYTTVQMWDRCRIQTAENEFRNYTENGLHKPVFPSVWMGGAGNFFDGRFEEENNVVPRKGHELTDFEITYDFSADAMFASVPAVRFLRIRTANDMIIDGWVDRIEPVSNRVGGDAGSVRIHWHADWYLTTQENIYSNLNQTGYQPYRIGGGRILRGPEPMARPDPSVPRRWVKGETWSLNTEGFWIILAFTVTDPGTGRTTLTYINWQPGTEITHEGVTYRTPTLDDVYAGLLEERFGLDPNTITGAWIAPQPAQMSPLGVYISGGYAAYQYTTSGSIFTLYRDMLETVKTDDSHKFVFIDTTGTEMGTAPWGLEFRHVITTVDAGSSGANLQIYLMTEDEWESTESHWREARCAEEGRLFSFPLPSLPITENAWASYNYSGQRDYDISTRQIQRDQNMASGVVSIGTGLAAGAVMGSVVPGVGTAVGAVAGAAAGAAGLVFTSISQNNADRASQAEADRLAASQAAGMIITAQGRRGIEPIGKEWGWRVVEMLRDPVSMAELQTEHDELGYLTDCYSRNCSALIAEGGPLRIENLEVSGCPRAEGDRYISAMFARGVHLDMLNWGQNYIGENE